MKQHSFMDFAQAERIATRLTREAQADGNDDYYEVVPTTIVGQYAIACFTAIKGEPVAFEGFL